jgi:uncharacterized protein
MLNQLTIPKNPDKEAALDYKQLYQIGLGHVQRLSSRIWTDYNVHDPGITALEQLCYAVTDLSYRAELPVKDLLAIASGNETNMHKQFFTARQILPNRALTVNDYRKLIIDVAGVKNAWIQNHDRIIYADTAKSLLSNNVISGPGVQAVHIKGLYDVKIDFMDDPKLDHNAIINNIKVLLNANRDLCEDFVNFSQVDNQDFLLCGDIELNNNADTSKVHAEILFQVQDYLAPNVRNYSLSEMLNKVKDDGTNYTMDEIFDGPALHCGFIIDEELEAADLRTEIHLSDIISIIMDIEGVRAVRDLTINPYGVTTLADKWIVAVATGKKPMLNRDKSRLIFYKRNMPVESDPTLVTSELKVLNDVEITLEETVHDYDLDIPLGNYRDLAEYYSLQNQFPVIYGLSEYGLTGGGGDARKALSYQLKGYLLFFDQLLANYMSQLANVNRLFSPDKTETRTYFYQQVNSFKDYDKIYKDADPVSDILNNIEDAAKNTARRNRFLEHMISRFAEEFTQVANILYSAFGTNGANIATLKCEFINEYPAISTDRGLAYNHTLTTAADLWNSLNISGLEKRISRLLGIRNYKRRNLDDIILDANCVITTTTPTDNRFKILSADGTRTLLNSNVSYTTVALANAAMITAINQAMFPASYQLKTDINGKFYFNVLDESGNIIARRLNTFDTEALRQAAIDEIIEYITSTYSNEGMYLIENLLLLPSQTGDPMLPIHYDPACTECASIDPYSYHVNIILPAFAGRFRNMHFREFAEDIIRAETPAHILPKICWISLADMKDIEALYKDWLYLESGANTTGRVTKLQNFIDKLFKLHSIYPQSKLNECGPDETVQKFILGQTALGSEKDNISDVIDG